MNLADSLTIITLILFYGSLATASPLAVGNNATETPPDAVCSLSGKGQKFCSGTIVKNNTFKNPFLVTAGHCLKDRTDTITVSCGCTTEGCLETFTIVSIEAEYNEKNFMGGLDYAFATLDKEPTLITPLEISKQDDFISKDKIADCLRGGFGINETKNMTDSPNLYTLNRGLSQTRSRGDGKKIIGDIYSFESPVYSSGSEYYKDLSKDLPLRLIQDARKSGKLNFLLPGDSGSGLLCRRSASEAYQMIGIYKGRSTNSTQLTLESGKNEQPRYKDKLTSREVFSALPQALLEE